MLFGRSSTVTPGIADSVWSNTRPVTVPTDCAHTQGQRPQQVRITEKAIRNARIRNMCLITSTAEFKQHRLALSSLTTSQLPGHCACPATVGLRYLDSSSVLQKNDDRVTMK